MTDRDRVLQALREAGSTGLHSTAMRRQGLTGNPSQRIAELRDRGYRISATSKPWKDADGKRRPGTTYTLISGPDPGLGAGTGPGVPAADKAASVEPGAAPGPGGGGGLAEAPAGSSGDPERLFDTVDIDIPAPAPSAYDPDAEWGEAA